MQIVNDDDECACVAFKSRAINLSALMRRDETTRRDRVMRHNELRESHTTRARAVGYYMQHGRSCCIGQENCLFCSVPKLCQKWAAELRCLLISTMKKTRFYTTDLQTREIIAGLCSEGIKFHVCTEGYVKVNMSYVINEIRIWGGRRDVIREGE